jgi:asparagine synthase (glutamine-hydrolysing)
MCGIAGFVKLRGVLLDGEEELVRRMTRTLEHRGPDDSGTWISGDRTVVLGHRRLSILDLSSAGHQPMVGSDGCVVAYNGEIYNYLELRRRFPEDSFRSASDTEVLLRCYETSGDKCLPEFNGMFGFALWDPRQEVLLLARDRAGIKPLYYCESQGVFAFASEIKALLSLPWIRPQLDESALMQFLSNNHLQAPATMFRGIHKLPPGHYLVVSRRGVQVPQPYWKPHWIAGGELSEADRADQLHDRLAEAVRRQMISDVPVGIFLSGGVDSSCLAALAAQYGEKRITTFSIGFKDAPAYDELAYARTVARQFKTDHIERIVSPAELIEFLPQVVEAYDEPLADATSVPMYFLSELARQHGRLVVLTGDGADELFCGYRRWARHAQLLRYYRRYRRLPVMLRRAAFRSWNWFDQDGTLNELLRQGAAGNEMYSMPGGFKTAVRNRCLRPEFLARLGVDGFYEREQRHWAEFQEFLGSSTEDLEMRWLSFSGFSDAVPNFYCHRSDRMGMAHSIEARVPFLDNEIIDLAFATPGQFKIRNGISKYILKKSMERHLSSDLLYRRKMGFCVPVREWAADMLADYVDRHLCEFCQQTGIFLEEELRLQLRALRSGRGDQAFGLWNLYFLMVWMKRWLHW